MSELTTATANPWIATEDGDVDLENLDLFTKPAEGGEPTVPTEPTEPLAAPDPTDQAAVLAESNRQLATALADAQKAQATYNAQQANQPATPPPTAPAPIPVPNEQEILAALKEGTPEGNYRGYEMLIQRNMQTNVAPTLQMITNQFATANQKQQDEMDQMLGIMVTNQTVDELKRIGQKVVLNDEVVGQVRDAIIGSNNPRQAAQPGVVSNVVNSIVGNAVISGKVQLREQVDPAALAATTTGPAAPAALSPEQQKMAAILGAGDNTELLTKLTKPVGIGIGLAPQGGR